MRAGLFDHWQGEYAARGIITFPVSRDKTPAVRGYMRAGRKASAQFALKFPDALGIGFACKRNRITVLDVDTKDERVLADGLSRHGQTPIVVRTGSGNYQAWYRHNGEARKIRPDPKVPIDILGDGFVVAPPTQASTGEYRIIQGSLDDVDRLPRMKVSPEMSAVAEVTPGESVQRVAQVSAQNALKQGDGRNDALFRRLLRAAHKADTKEELMQFAAQANLEFASPLPGDEVVKTAASAWRYKEQGRLFVPGGEATAVVFHSDLEHLWNQPLALKLLIQLRMAHGWRNGGEFYLSQDTAKTLGVSIPTFRAARDTLVARHFVEITHPGGKGKKDPPRARLL